VISVICFCHGEFTVTVSIAFSFLDYTIGKFVVAEIEPLRSRDAKIIRDESRGVCSYAGRYLQWWSRSMI
jgi:hypothetical protein